MQRHADEDLARPRIVALFPKSTRDPYGIQVQLEKVKQGTYHTQRATLLTFKVSLDALDRFSEACFELRLAIQHKPWFGEDRGRPPFIGAYGPAHIEEKSEGARVGQRIPAGVRMSLIRNGALAFVRGRMPEVQVIPEAFCLGIVVVHEQAAQIMVLPSTLSLRRAKAFRRTRVRPIDLNMDGDAGSDLITCALQSERGCHPTCDIFDQAHMTPNVWKSLLAKGDAEYYDGETVAGWVNYAPSSNE